MMLNIFPKICVYVSILFYCRVTAFSYLEKIYHDIYLPVLLSVSFSLFLSCLISWNKPERPLVAIIRSFILDFLVFRTVSNTFLFCISYIVSCSYNLLAEGSPGDESLSCDPVWKKCATFSSSCEYTSAFTTQFISSGRVELLETGRHFYDFGNRLWHKLRDQSLSGWSLSWKKWPQWSERDWVKRLRPNTWPFSRCCSWASHPCLYISSENNMVI